MNEGVAEDRGQGYRLLLQGIDTLQCAYFMGRAGEGIDYQGLAEKKEEMQRSKYKQPVVVCLGNSEFLLHPYGTASGYPYLLTNDRCKIECGEFNNPNFYVTYPSQALWHDSAFVSHQRFLEWASSAGYEPFKVERLSRVDFSFDYELPHVDFNEDWFVSRSSKDSQHRADGRLQTLTFGKGDVVLRVYDKVAEIGEKSDKTWFYELWGKESDVWRIEWQVRKNVLQRFDVRSFEDLDRQQGDVLRYLACEHDSLRVPNGKANGSRDWPVHPLWLDLQERIGKLNHIGICRSFDEGAGLEEKKMQIAVSVSGYVKRLAAIRCLQSGTRVVSHSEALEELQELLWQVHEPLAWEVDVTRRANEMRLGKWN